jgi:hypothetical protein
MQSKKKSLIESVTNVIVGYSLSVIAQIIIFPIFGIYANLKSNFKIALTFTAISIIRSYMNKNKHITGLL